MSPAQEEFVSEPIEPEAGTFDARGMARGEAGLPQRFRWRGRVYGVRGVLEEWKSSGPETGGSELYLRRHWFRVVAEPVEEGARGSGPDASRGMVILTLYCLRKTPAGGAKKRWWAYSWAGG